MHKLEVEFADTPGMEGSEESVSMCCIFQTIWLVELTQCNFSSKGKPTPPTITKIKTCARETQIKHYL